VDRVVVGQWSVERNACPERLDRLVARMGTAGASWEHVIAVNSYHVGFPEDVNQIMAERFRHHMPDHAPIWTALGVAALGHPKMCVEIRVTAITS
jgi:enamine deaminase RidA (YjgF/YER057c/UK114 family)